MPQSPVLLDFTDSRPFDIDQIHQATGFYTVNPEVNAVLDLLDWPNVGTSLLDPGAGNGAFVLAALARIPLEKNDVTTAVQRVRGYEFHPGAAREARNNIYFHLRDRHWDREPAIEAAAAILEIRDFLLDELPEGKFDVIAANPPYLRRERLPAGYRIEYDFVVPDHAQADMLHAYLEQCTQVISPHGRIGLVTADRWLVNDSASKLRERIGQRYSALHTELLDGASVFYRAKERIKNADPRVHPVRIVLTPDRSGRIISKAPFRVDQIGEDDGQLLSSLVSIKLSPWVGANGIFLIDNPQAFPAECIAPAVLPTDINGDTGTLKPTTKWILLTNEDEPHPAVLQHLDANLHNMAPRGRRTPRWLPPEKVGPLPLAGDAVLVPRIAKHLKAVRLPAGHVGVDPL